MRRKRQPAKNRRNPGSTEEGGISWLRLDAEQYKEDKKNAEALKSVAVFQRLKEGAGLKKGDVKMDGALKREAEAIAKAGKEREEDAKARDEYRELAEAVLALPISAGRVARVKRARNLAELSESNTDVRTGFVLALAKNGLEGDVRAQQLLLALAGVKTNRKEVEVSGERPAAAVIYLPDNGRDAS